MTKISEIGVLKNGLNFNRDHFGEGIGVVNVKQLYNGRYVDTNNLETIKSNSIPNLESYLLEEGDILFARSSVMRSGSGKSALIPKLSEKISFSGFTIRLRIKDKNKFNPLYLIYILSASKYRKLFQQFSTGTSISNVSQDLINSLEIKMPNINLQKKIIEIIGSFDDKIELNKKKNLKLEEVAKTIFKSWFVDFDLVREKKGKKFINLSKEIIELFPDSFENSELGQIPKGWKVSFFSDVFNIQGGFAFKSKDFSNKGSSVIKIRNIKDDGTIDTSKCDKLLNVSKKLDPYLLNDGDVLIAMTGAMVGKVGFISIENKKFYLNQRVGRLKPIGKNKKCYYSYLLLNSKKTRNFIESTAYGSAQPNISSNDIESILNITPPKDVILKFNEIIYPYFEKILLNYKENIRLEEIRELILNEHIAGKLKNLEIEKIISERNI